MYLPSPDSPLTLGTSWLAVLMTGTCERGRPYGLESRLMTRAITSILAVVKDPVNIVKDETLKTVTLIAYGEYHSSGNPLLAPLDYKNAGDIIGVVQVESCETPAEVPSSSIPLLS